MLMLPVQRGKGQDQAS